MSVTITGGISFSGGVGIVAAPLQNTAGWFGGGFAPAGGYSNITRLVFATDTAATTNRTYLSSSRYGIAALSGIQ
jgi:hypothetical protein